MWKPTNTYALDTNNFNIVLSPAGYKYFINDNLFTVSQAFHEYHYSDMTRDDIVLDLGANIGGFSILAAGIARRVCSVEPIMFQELNRNIALNNMQDKITTHRLCLDYHQDPALWRHYSQEHPGKTFTELKDLAGDVSFLKMDVDGPERDINPKELKGIPAIEMEIHRPFNNHLTEWLKRHYTVEMFQNSKDSYLVHARVKP